MKHDQLWKDVLWTFFREFLELFFPNVADHIDFDHLRLLAKELFTDIPQGLRREPDILVEASTKTGEVELLLIHIEVQAKRERDVPFRMWEYYSLLRLRKRHPVLPIVVYLSSGTGGVVKERYSESLFGEGVLTFEYTAIALPDPSEEEYFDRDNVLAPALSALMRSNEEDRVTRKLKAYERLARLRMDEAKRSLLFNVVNQYIPLAQSEKFVLVRRMKQTESKEVIELLTEWEEEAMKKGVSQGVSKGIIQGMEQGLTRGKRETLLRQMKRKFGDLPENVIICLQNVDKAEVLDELADRVLDAKSLEEMRLNEI